MRDYDIRFRGKNNINPLVFSSKRAKAIVYEELWSLLDDEGYSLQDFFEEYPEEELLPENIFRYEEPWLWLREVQDILLEMVIDFVEYKDDCLKEWWDEFLRHSERDD